MAKSTRLSLSVGLLIKEKKNFKAAKALVLAFIGKEDPAHGRSSIKHRAGGAPSLPPVPAATEGTRNTSVNYC